MKRTTEATPQQTPKAPGNLTALRAQYKHKRMQSKNQLINHYRSLSLIAGDDFSKILDRQAKRVDQGVDFDDLSSIYTAHARNDILESTLKRVRDREVALSAMDEMEDV